MNKKNIIRIVALIILGIGAVAAIVYMVTKPKQQSTGIETRAGYSTITSVSGISFMVNSAFTESATAITQISDDMEFTSNEFYSYKNGQDQYILFNMDSESGIVVAAQKGTNFNFSETKKEEDNITASDIMGIWFSFDKDGDKVSSSGGKYETTVIAQVSITKDLYSDFIGKLVVIEQDDEEWALFVGIPGNRYKNLSKNARSGIETIAESVKRGDYTVAEEEYAVVINDSSEEVTEVAITDGTKEKETEPEPGDATELDKTPSEEITLEESSEEASEEVLEEIVTEEENAETEATDTSTEEQTEIPEEAEDIPEPEKELENPEDNKSSDEQEEADVEELTEAEESDKTKGVTVKSTVNTTKDDSKAYTSSPYSMVTVGQASIFNSVNGSGEKEDLIVRIEEILDSTRTTELVRDAATSGNLEEAFTTAPAGCHWEGALYSIKYSEETKDPYVNVKLLGVDGEVLKFRGIKYSSFTYDVNISYENDGWVVNKMVYYAVPNGCTTYCLMIGDGDNIKALKSAYYYINRK